ncbi:MAG: hypothetical protein KDA77_10925, partial [Planctomycetaceae bacterium]|nr:hypothetical protein [Planctomycetaceae bacterium]
MYALKQNLVIHTISGLICGLQLILISTEVSACPFCPGPSRTLTEQLSQADTAVLVQWTESAAGTREQAGKTVFEVKQVIHQTKQGKLSAGDRITVNRQHQSRQGTLFLLPGTPGTDIHWGEPIEVTALSFRYIMQAPGLEETTTE